MLASQPDVCARVLATHVRLLSGDAEQLEKAVRCARKYTERTRGNAEVWLARLDAERTAGVGDEDVARTWREGRRRVNGEGKERVWLWGLRDDESGREICEVRACLSE